jgi:HK97 family phage portal protein
VPPTVGPDDYTPGDANGVVVVDDGGSATVPPPLRTQPWDGWPGEWATPGWFGRWQDLTDTAWACLDKNSGVIGTMPPYLVGAADSLNSGWLTNPDPNVYGGWPDFARQLFWDYQAVGEAFVVVTARYATGWPARFHVLEPWAVNVEVDGEGMRRYSVGGQEIPRDDPDVSPTFRPTPTIVHLRYQGTASEAHGHGPLEAGRSRLVAAGVLARYATNLAASGGVPHSVLKYPGRLTEAQAAKLQMSWVQARMSSIGLPAVLTDGIELEVTQLSPEQMALVDLSRWNESRIAILLGVPPFLVGLPSGGDAMTYSNVNALFMHHWQAGLKPMVARVMTALSGCLLPLGTTVELNRDEYIQAGPAERVQYYEAMVRIGAMTPEQVAEKERTKPGVAAPTAMLTSGVLQ